MKRMLKSSLVNQIEDSLQRRDETRLEPTTKREPSKRNLELLEENNKKDLPKANRNKRDEEKSPDNPNDKTKSKTSASIVNDVKEDSPMKEEVKPPEEKKKKRPKKPVENKEGEPEGNGVSVEKKTKKKRRNIGIGGLRKEERGKTTPDTLLFTDQDLFKDKSDWNISGFTVWHNTKYITGIMTHYRDSAGNPINGSKNVCANAESQYKKQEISFDAGDYLKSLTGTFEKTETYVQSLTIVTANDDVYTVGKALETSKHFEFDLNEYEYPVVVFGGLELEHGKTLQLKRLDFNDFLIDDTMKEIGSKLSKIGVLIKSDAVEEQIELQEDGERRRIPAKLTQKVSQE